MTVHTDSNRTSGRTVAGRLFASLVILLLAFVVTLGWSFRALRASARDASNVRNAYVPILLTIDEALAAQNVMNAQLNHITSATNATDIRRWIETARRVRPATLTRLKEDAEEAAAGDASNRALTREVLSSLAEIAKILPPDERLSALFAAIDARDSKAAENIRDQVVSSETRAAQKLRSLRLRVSERMTVLVEDAQERERGSSQLLIGLTALTLAIAAAIALYLRRVLKPLNDVTERAQQVAAGDLTARDVSPANDEIGKLAATFEVMVGAIRQTRSDLVEAERLATIGKMAARITHEIRNPLSSIGLNLELLEEELPPGKDEDEARQLLGAIRRELERLSRTSEQYLAAATEPRVKLESEDIFEVVRDVAAFYRAEFAQSDVELRLEIPDAELMVRLDDGLIRQALINLMRNAREAMPDGGVLTLKAELTADGQRVTVVVRDTGTGIAEEVRAHLFDPFFTTKRHGTGLGLVVTKSIVDAHDGLIECWAAKPSGTEFRISLPIEPDPLAPLSQRSGPIAPPSQSRPPSG